MEYHTAMTKCKALRRDIESHGRGTRRKAGVGYRKSQGSSSSNRREGLGLGDVGRGGVQGANFVVVTGCLLFNQLGCMHFSLSMQYFSNFKKKNFKPGSTPTECCPSQEVAPRGPSVPRVQPQATSFFFIKHQPAPPGRKGASFAGTEPEKPEAQGLWSWVGGAAVLTLLGDVKQVPSSLSPQSPHLSNGVSSSPGAPLTWQMDEVPRQCWETVITLGKLRPKKRRALLEAPHPSPTVSRCQRET